MKLNRTFLFYCCALLLLSASESRAAIGQSAVITLSFPFGARASAMGETFTGVADNVDATFYNPAGLGQSPLANTWKAHYPVSDISYTVITAKQKRSFGKKEKIWLATNSRGLMQYNGKLWTTYDTYLIEEGDDLRDIAEKFLKVDNDQLINHAIKALKEVNGIGTNRYKTIIQCITPHLIDSLRSRNDREELVDNLANTLLSLDVSDRNATHIYGIIASKVDSLAADSIADELAKVYAIKDIEFSELVEIKIPFSIAIRDSITAMVLDESDRLWVGTNKGLWRYDGSAWNNYTMLDGLPSNRIIALAASQAQEIAVATDMGIGIFHEGDWSAMTVQDGLPDSVIHTLAFGKDNDLYVGTDHGLALRKDGTWTVFDTTQGLLSQKVLSLLYDSENKLWIGGLDGVTIFDNISWKRYKFPGSNVQCIAEYKPGRIWLGTNRGAISYRAGKVKTDNTGKTFQEPPKWKPFHSKNALTGNDVKSITVHGKDVWLITDKAVNQYNRGDNQISLFYEPLLPAFDLPDLWHAAIAGIFPTEEWGTLGFYLNYLSFGENDQYDAQGHKTASFQSYEYVLSLCYGLPLKENFSFGLNVKYVHSALAPGIGEGSEGVGQTFAIDAAILRKNLFIKNFNIGFMLMNMGPSVFYITREEADPIPFTARLGLSYTIVETPIHTLLAALDLDREIVKNVPYERPYPFWKAIYYDLINDADESVTDELEQIIGHLGIEYWYVNFLALRMGMLYDEAGTRQEMHMGLGLKYGNMAVDWFYIYSPKKSVARDGQWGFSFFYSF